MRASEFIVEGWSSKYKKSINCSHPKGFSQKAHCAGKSKRNESIEMEMVCADCGMCESHGNINEIKKGAKDSNGVSKCWPGYHAAGTKKSATTGKQVRNCVKNESEELEEEFDLIESIIEQLAEHNGVDAEVIWADLETLTEDELYAFAVTSEPVMEGEVVTFPKKHRGDLDDVHECVKCGGDLQGGTYMGQRIKVCVPCKQVYLPPNSDIDQNGNKIAEQGVAEGLGGNWYIRVNGKILNDTKFKPVIFSSEDEARSHAMKLADKKRIPLSQIKLTKSWMDAPEQGVAEGELDKFKKYTRPVTKTTPKIEKTTNPSGRTTDHVEWKVTTPTGEIHRYKSKKQAQEHFDSFGQQDMAEGENKGLYYNVNKRKKAGTSRDANSPKAPTAQAWKDAAKTAKKEDLEEDWQKTNKRDKTDGMSQKAVNAYRRENPGSKLKTAVTTKPSKLKKGSKASKRRSSYCSRSRGQMKMHSISCAKTPDKAICKARRRWNC